MSKVKFIDFISNLAGKAGIPADNPAMKALQALKENAQLTAVDLPEELTSAIDSSLMTLSAAKNNSELAKHFKAQSYSGIDARIAELVDEAGLNDDAKAKINGEKSTGEKIKLLATSIREKAAAEGGKVKEPKLDEITRDYEAKLKAQKEDFEKLLSEEKNKVEGVHLDFALRSLISGSVTDGKKLIFDEKTPAALRDQIVLTAIQTSLSSQGIKPALVDGKLVFRNAEGQIYHDANHKEVSPAAWVDKTLADAGLFVVNNNNPPKNIQQTGGGIGGQQQTIVSSDATDHFSQAKAQFPEAQ